MRRIKTIIWWLMLVSGVALCATAPRNASTVAADAMPTTGMVCTTNPSSTFTLTTKSDYISLPDGNLVFMWSFTEGNNAFQFPGPVLCVNEGDTVTVVLNNTLNVPVSIMFPGQVDVLANNAPVQPQFSGANVTSLVNPAPAGGSVTYRFVAQNPGTYLYQSGTNSAVQVQMGLFGALVVRPSMGANYAYNRADTQFAAGQEYLMLLSEIDPALHSAIENGQIYNMANYRARYWQINGRSFPDTIAPNGAAWLPEQPYGSAPGSNIVAAEWYEGTAPAPGSGTPMLASDGSFNSASENVKYTFNIATMTLGNHTYYVRVKDAVGYWSTVGSVTVNVQIPNAIFSDGFESGNTSAWSSVSGATQLTVNTAAALNGTYGLKATIAGNTPSYVQDNTPNNDASYNARFVFNPNGTSTGTGQHTIFVGRTSGGGTIFQVQYRRTGASPSFTYQVRAVVNRSGGTNTGTWYTINGNAANTIEISWASSGSATFNMYIGGSLKQTWTGLNTSALKLDAVRLGPSTGLTSSMSGSEYFDNFASTRTTYIGP